MLLCLAGAPPVEAQQGYLTHLAGAYAGYAHTILPYNDVYRCEKDVV